MDSNRVQEDLQNPTYESQYFSIIKLLTLNKNCYLENVDLIIAYSFILFP